MTRPEANILDGWDERNVELYRVSVHLIIYLHQIHPPEISA